MFRINFGNGQVQGPYDTRAEADRAFYACNPDGYTYLQEYHAGSADDPGDWFRVTTPGLPARGARSRVPR